MFSPFNCRRVLATGPGTPRSARQDNYPLHRRICERTLPEVLEYGFNEMNGGLSEIRQLSCHERVRTFLREKAKRIGSGARNQEKNSKERREG